MHNTAKVIVTFVGLFYLIAVITMPSIHTKRDSANTMHGMVGLMFCIIFTTSIPLDPYPLTIDQERTNQAIPPDASHSRLVKFDIPAGDLALAIVCAVEQAQLNLAFDPKLTRGRVTSGLAGTFPTAVALERLVKDADLQVVPMPGNRYRIEPKPDLLPRRRQTRTARRRPLGR